MPLLRLLLAVAVIAPAVAAPFDDAAGAGGGRACAGPRLSALDLRYAGEYRRLLGARAATVWPGWRPIPPLLQRKGGCEYLIGHESPPRGFERVPGLRVQGARVDVARAGTATPAVVASTWRVGAVWVAMVPTRGEFQQAVDRQLGRGAVRLTDTAYIRSLVHEAFHAFQMTARRGALPSFRSTLEEPEATALLARLGDGEARLAREGAALSAALTAATPDGARANEARFAALRAARRGATGKAAALAAFERRIEWAEGSARYADLRLVLLATSGGYTPTRGIRYTPAAAYRRTFLAGLARAAARPDGLRGRWQDLGAAQALLLDRRGAGWKRAALVRGASLEALLRAGAR